MNSLPQAKRENPNPDFILKIKKYPLNLCNLCHIKSRLNLKVFSPNSPGSSPTLFIGSIRDPKIIALQARSTSLETNCPMQIDWRRVRIRLLTPSWQLNEPRGSSLFVGYQFPEGFLDFAYLKILIHHPEGIWASSILWSTISNFSSSSSKSCVTRFVAILLKVTSSRNTHAMKSEHSFPWPRAYCENENFQYDWNHGRSSRAVSYFS